jgi:AcrR family transcriptional regulator
MSLHTKCIAPVEASIDSFRRVLHMRQNAPNDAQNEDLRVRKTRKGLQDALIALLGERAFESITAGEIAARAMVNRATFYRHYRDKFDLAHAIFAGALDAMVGTLGRPDTPLVDPHPQEEDFQRAWASLFHHVAANERLYRAIFNGSDGAAFTRLIREHLVKIVKRRTEERIRLRQPMRGTARLIEQPADDLPYMLVANTLLGSLVWWLDDGMHYEADKIIEWTRRLLRHGYPGLLALPQTSSRHSGSPK